MIIATVSYYVLINKGKISPIVVAKCDSLIWLSCSALYRFVAISAGFNRIQVINLTLVIS